jgi:hypothetical protein
VWLFQLFQFELIGGYRVAVASMASTLVSQAQSRARQDPRFARVLAALVAAPTESAGEYSRIAARELNEQRIADAVASFKETALPTRSVQQMLGLGTPQAVHQMRGRGRIIGLQLGNATWFPAWQFTDGRLRADLPRLLGLLHEFGTDVLAIDRVMRLERDELGGHSIATALDLPDRSAVAWVMLQQLGS